MEFSPEGYMPPSALKRYEAPKGLNSWPAIFAYPGVCPLLSSFRYHHSHTHPHNAAHIDRSRQLTIGPMW